MNGYLARLNPGERRFVVIVGMAVFVVVNLIWVWPHFSDWGNLQGRLLAARTKLAKYEAMIQQKATLEPELKKLEGEGSNVPLEDQAGEFFRAIQVQAGQSGVFFMGNSSRAITTTNQFFTEKAQTITVQGTEKQLVDFLYHLGAGNSLIRVRAISIHPDPSHTRLFANITLVASYQKTQKRRGAARSPEPAVVKTSSPAARTAHSKSIQPKLR